MSDISHKVSSDGVRNCSESCVVEISGISTCTTQKHVRLEFSDCSLKSIVVNKSGLFVDVVRLRLEVMTARRDFFGLSLMTVSQMTAMCQGKSHQAGTRFEEASVYSKVSGTSGEWLDVDRPLLRVSSEGFKGALLAQTLNFINDLVTAIVALAGVALRVLVCEARTKSFHDCLGSEVFAGNKFNATDLSLLFFFNEGGHLWVDFCDASITHGEGLGNGVSFCHLFYVL